MYISQSDPLLADLIHKELSRQQTGLELIASENYVSHAVLEANASVLTNKYSEGYPGKRYYAGQEVVDEIENLAISRAKELFGAEYVNVQPLSGSPANAAIYLALLNPGDTILWMRLDQGGHLSHGHPMNMSGKLYNIVAYGVREDTHRIDMDEVRELALKHRPKIIVAGFSAYSRDLDWKGFRAIADECGAILMADIAHIAGLIAGKALENPVPLCDVVSTTTHKTLRGPRGAMIMSKAAHESALAKAVFPGLQGGPHEHTIAAKAVAFGEALRPEFQIYAKNVILNAQTFASALIEKGWKISSGGTDNHLFLVDMVSSCGLTGKEAEARLESVGISVNKNMIPFDPRKPLDPSGIRFGTAAVTTRGFDHEDIRILADIVYETCTSSDLEGQKKRVLELAEKRKLYS